MDKDFEVDLKGTTIEATNAKQQIAKYFDSYGNAIHEECKKHQLMFASKIMCVITKCEGKNLDIYCSIIEKVFSNQLCPEASVKYWTLYVNCIRYFHYSLIEKKEFEKAALIYRHISEYKNKLQSIENSLTCVNIYCYQLLLQNSLRSKNAELALSEATHVVENLTKLFGEILHTNIKQNFQYPDILQKSMSWLFPQNKTSTVYHFLKTLPTKRIEELFQSLFRLCGRQTINIKTTTENDVQEHAKFIMETVYMLLQVDVLDKMQLQLSVQLMSYCRTECRLKTYPPITEAFHLLYDYLKLLCAQQNTLDFQHNFCLCCKRFKELFEKYSKILTNQSWFGDFLVLIFYIHSQLQNQSIFFCFWKQMNKPNCYSTMLNFFVDLMKLAPCISADTKLFTINCCTSIRKHVILSFAQIALATFVFYCQNTASDGERQQQIIENLENHLEDNYNEAIQDNLLLIINHAFKIIDKMDCIGSNSQEIEIILTRLKQATLSCKTNRQAATCIGVGELFLKIRTKIDNKNWSLLLRRLYKTATQLMVNNLALGRDLQMCYITSLLQNALGLIDLNQIRTQIGIFYEARSNEQKQDQPNEHCLLHLYQTSNSLLRPHLEVSSKKLLHWLESQHILKYYKSNTTLLHSVLKCSQSHYDFVLIIKLGKLQTYAMAKITSLYKTLNLKEKSSSSSLTRLEHLIFGHICVMLLNDMSANQKFQIDSKCLSEEQLENLVLREEMSSITICNDLKRFKLAWKAFTAFECFFEKFDSDMITMDEAIIDWESLLDDLAGLALCLELSGYMEQSLKVWLLHYKISRLIQDNISALRGLAFFCEHSEHFDKKSQNNCLKLDEEIQNNLPTLTQGLENLAHLQRQAFQTYILIAVAQIAYYYARTSRSSFAQMLLQYVQLKHAELGERQGRYDIVLATMDAIKFRLLWKHFKDATTAKEANTRRTEAEHSLFHRCLLHEAEETLDRFHEFSCISSCDGLLYSILIINLVQELAECTVNRLCDSFINALFVATCKCTLTMGLALRFVQVMSMWMWVNLQMEYVDRAQVKLKMIEFVLGLKSLKDLAKVCPKSMTDIQSKTLLPTFCVDLHQQQGMEAIRKLAQVQLSPIKTDKLQLSPSHRNSDLKRYFKSNIDTKLMSLNEQLEWTFFTVGCLNARLYFLVEDYEQLELFYECGKKWLQMRQNCFNSKYYRHIELMAIHHYANFLRAKRSYQQALECLEYGIKLCESQSLYIDAVYTVNFQLQHAATQKEMSNEKVLQSKVPNRSKLRRALQFNISPENRKTPVKNDQKHVMVSAKKSSAKIKPIPSADNTGCSSSKKLKTQKAASTGSDVRTTKAKPKFEICEDLIEIKEIVVDDGDIQNELVLKRTTKLLADNGKTAKTPKISRKTTKSAKTTGTKSSVKYKRPETIPKFKIECLSSPASHSSSSLENLEPNENLISNELARKMKTLEINKTSEKKPTTQIAAKKLRYKPLLSTESTDDVIVLSDSPCVEKQPPLSQFEDKLKASRTRNAIRDKVGHAITSCEDNLATSSSRARRQRKPLIDNKECSSISSTIATPITTRRRQKNLV